MGNFYDQIDGVAMGSPLAPVLANLFMGHHEKRWLENYSSGIEFYRRYVDDTFALFNSLRTDRARCTEIGTLRSKTRRLLERGG